MRNQLLFGARVALTLALSWAAAAACVALHTPLPWMIGPLLATSLLSIGGAPTESWAPLRNAGQWSIGASLGLYFTPQVVALVASLWWAIALGIVWALVLGWCLVSGCTGFMRRACMACRRRCCGPPAILRGRLARRPK